MKKLIIPFCMSLLLMTACKKENSLQSNGQITGADPRMCACCGGWFINIDNETYRFYDLPAESDLDLTNASFPIQVELNWNTTGNGCMGDEIVIDELKRK